MSDGSPAQEASCFFATSIHAAWNKVITAFNIHACMPGMHTIDDLLYCSSCSGNRQWRTQVYIHVQEARWKQVVWRRANDPMHTEVTARWHDLSVGVALNSDIIAPQIWRPSFENESIVLL